MMTVDALHRIVSDLADKVSEVKSTAVNETTTQIVNNVTSPSLSIKWIEPIQVATNNGSLSATSFAEFDCGPYIPSGASAVLLECFVVLNNPNSASILITSTTNIVVRTPEVSDEIVVCSGMAAGGDDATSTGGVFLAPVSSTRKFEWKIDNSMNGEYRIRLVGYV